MSLSTHDGSVVIAAAAALIGAIVFITHIHIHRSHERQASESHLSFSRHLNLADPIACMSWKQSDAVELVESNEEATELYQAEEKSEELSARKARQHQAEFLLLLDQVPELRGEEF